MTLSGAMLNNPGIQNIPEGAIPGDSTLAMETGGGTFSKPQAAATAPVMFAAGATTATPSVATAAAATLRRGLRWAGVGAKRRLHDFNVQGNPPISTVQWTWLETTLAQSTANWCERSEAVLPLFGLQTRRLWLRSPTAHPLVARFCGSLRSRQRCAGSSLSGTIRYGPSERTAPPGRSSIRCFHS